MSRTLPRRAALAGAALSLALGLAACGGSEPSDTATAAAGGVTEMSEVPATVPVSTPTPESVPEAVPAPPSTAAAPATTAAPRKAPPTTAARTTAPSAPATTPAPPATTAPVTPKFAPGQRINPTGTQVQAAMSALTQRIPLFKPNEAQLRTFADAACTSFDQGQNFSQVSSTIRQAVTYVQGASITAADSDFAARTVVTLRCPGYLP